jgi:hypothetical protein
MISAWVMFSSQSILPCLILIREKVLLFLPTLLQAGTHLKQLRFHLKNYPFHNSGEGLRTYKNKQSLKWTIWEWKFQLNWKHKEIEESLQSSIVSSLDPLISTKPGTLSSMKVSSNPQLSSVMFQLLIQIIWDQKLHWTILEATCFHNDTLRSLLQIN